MFIVSYRRAPELRKAGVLHHLLLAVVIALVAVLFSAGILYEEWSRRQDALRFPQPGQLIDMGGRRLHLLSRGTEAPTVVIEQGAGGLSLAWLAIQEEVSKFTRVCIYDRAGYQWSDPLQGRRSIEDRVKDLHTLLERANLPGPYVLVAHSYGGFLVRLFAREYPGSVAGLVLVDTPHEIAYFRRDVLSLYSKIEWFMLAMRLLSIVGLPRLVNRFTAKPEDRQITLSMVRREYFSAARDDIGSIRRAAFWLTKPGSLGQLGDLPLAVITHGVPFPGPFAVLDTQWREGQEKLAALSTDSTLSVAEKSNHMIQNDEPEVVIEAIQSVVARSRRAATKSEEAELANGPIAARSESE